jgi:hypothetical protein
MATRGASLPIEQTYLATARLAVPVHNEPLVLNGSVCGQCR